MTRKTLSLDFASKGIFALLTAVTMAGFSTAAVNATTITTFDVTVTANDPTWRRPAQDNNSSYLRDSLVHFATTDFTVADSGTYSILSQQIGGDGYIHLYEDSFDPLNQYSNFIVGDDDYDGTRQSFIEAVELVAGTNYVLVSNWFSSGLTGTHSYTITGTNISAVPLPAGGLLLISGLAGVAALKRRKQRAA